jgi:outer membrane protein OmpA-like peptidoglycan-associated protein
MKKAILIVIVLLTAGYIYGQENYRIKNLEVNTKYSDFGTSYYQGEIIYASSKPGGNKSQKNWTNGQPYLELYRGVITPDGEVVDSKPFSEQLNTKYHESNAVFTKDGKTVYFTRNNYFQKRYGLDTLGWNNLKLFRADVDEMGKWSNELPLPFNDDNYSVGHPALSPDGRTLYFTSDMPGSMGQTDIFKCSVGSDGTYGSPINLGTQVNTYGKEMFPMVTDSGKLYFSSDGRQGSGGLDVYVVPTNNTSVAPINLGSPINSPSDDFCFVIDEPKKNGYFSSNRDGGKGDDDIYYFDELNAPDFSCNQVIAGVVRDKNSGALLPNSMVTLYNGSTKVESVMVGSDASFRFTKLDCEMGYRVTGERELYQGDEKTVTTTDQADLELGVDLVLTPDAGPIKETEYIDRCQYALDNINTIYFDLDKYYIRPDAAIELEKIVKVMNKCQDVTIEARSHTDSRASHPYNVILSQNRAQSTVDYIVSRGILKDRISAKGFGETELLNRCKDGVNCSEGEHQVNRRTEFVIIRKK